MKHAIIIVALFALEGAMLAATPTPSSQPASAPVLMTYKQILDSERDGIKGPASIDGIVKVESIQTPELNSSRRQIIAIDVLGQLSGKDVCILPRRADNGSEKISMSLALNEGGDKLKVGDSVHIKASIRSAMWEWHAADSAGRTRPVRSILLQLFDVQIVAK